jgi:hypothetical protein
MAGAFGEEVIDLNIKIELLLFYANLGWRVLPFHLLHT